MSSEPERDIEKQIRTYAEKRRDESGERFAMHPATRQKLHEEVADAIPRETPEQTPITVLHAEETLSFWSLFKRQFALVCVFAIVLSGLGIAWVKYGNRSDVELAKAESAAAAQDVVQEVPPPLEIVNLDREPEVTSGLDAPAREIPAQPVSPPPTATAAPAPVTVAASTAAASDEMAKPVEAVTAAKTAGAEPEPAPAPTPKPAPQLTTPDPNRPSQQFVNSAGPRKYRRNFNSPPPVEFLTSFQVQQVGRQLLLVDRDGSTFSGEIAPPNNGAKSLVFRVSGQSRALRQSVVIEGSLTPNGGPEAGSNLSDLRVANESHLPLDRLRIDARATIGAESRPIRATPASRQ